MTNDRNELIRRLDVLLDTERQALIDGQFDALADIVSEKETLIEALNEEEFESTEEIAPVNVKVVRNQALLEQALDGVRSVARRLGEIRQARKQFDTYDERGHKNRIETGSEPSVEKRA